ncbi:fimbrillin family protein [Parabacteroides timonensis]|uniref:fimbrillin family protein n=1 Tax=Parabacteroides timonensis TaxID=1871013 RepID=UPI00094E9B58|nr:fimbrillin family protein [Parabacteroides timonensis]
MKQYLYTFPVAVFLSLCAACTQADIVVPTADDGEGGSSTEKGTPLSVKNLGLSVEVESRSIVTGGPVGDAANPNPLITVGLCVTKQSSSGAVSVYASGNNTQVFTYNTQVDPAVWQLAEGEEQLLLHSDKGTVYAFSPVEKSVSLAGNPKVPLMSSIKVLDKQKFYFNDGGNPVDASTDVQWECDQDDYLYCKAATEVDRWNPDVSLTMYHALAKVSFRILETDGGSAFAGSNVKKIVLKSSVGFKKSTSAKLSLETGELSGTTTAVDELWFTADGDMRAIGTNVTDPKQVPVQAFGLVIPVTGIPVTLELTLDDNRVFTMAPVEGSSTPGTFIANWLKGNNYIYNIQMLPQGIVIADIEVAGWNDGGSTDVPVE